MFVGEEKLMVKAIFLWPVKILEPEVSLEVIQSTLCLVQASDLSHSRKMAL